MAIETRNPATGELLESFEAISAAEVESRLQRAADCYSHYRQLDFGTKRGLLNRVADLLEQRVEEIAAVVTVEMGRPMAAARAEVLKCAVGVRYYADHGEAFMADEMYAAEPVFASQAFTRYRPIGPVLAVMPWNYPLWQVIRFAAPALMAGNVCILKHASNVPRAALMIERVFADAGFPPGAFQTLLIGSGAVEAIIRDRRVAAVTITGSEAAGRAVASAAGDALKKVVLELGGSDAFIVLPSADLQAAAAAGAKSRLQNAGQSCICAKRFIVHSDCYDEFVELFVTEMSAVSMGDPTDPTTTLGPLATKQGRDDIEALVQDAIAGGAQVLCGGVTPAGPGWFYPPTVLTGITPAMRAHTEELFAPVAIVYRAADFDDALKIANDSDLGLGGNAWTTDVDEIETLVNDVEAGLLFVNGVTASYPELPFGGIKSSGYGRELSALGMREFCNAKTIWIA